MVSTRDDKHSIPFCAWLLPEMATRTELVRVCSVCSVRNRTEQGHCSIAAEPNRGSVRFEFVRLVRNDSFLIGNTSKGVKELSKSRERHDITYRCLKICP